MKENAVKVTGPVVKEKAKWTFKKETIFTLLMVAVSLYAFIDATTFPFGSGLYPMVIAIICLGLAAGQVVLELHQKVLIKEALDVKVEESQKGKAAMKRALKFVAWLFGLFVGMYLIGFQIVVLPWVFAFMVFQGHIRWWRSLIIVAIAAVLILRVMPDLLQMEPPTGLFQDWWYSYRQ